MDEAIQGDVGDDELEGASGDGRRPPGPILTLACTAQFMVILDVSIVNVALPAMKSSLHLDQRLLAVGCQCLRASFSRGFLLLGGRLSDVFGERRVFIGGSRSSTVSPA